MSLNIQEVFAGLTSRFRPEKAGDYAGIFHFDLGEVQFTVEISARTCQVEEGLQGVPVCTLRTDVTTYLDTELGLRSAQEAVLSGQIRIDNLPEMMRYSQFFRKLEFPADTYSKGRRQGQPSRKPHTGPLQGLKVLDFTRLLPGPLGTMLLADMGAEVIKIEAPKFYDYTRDFPPHKGGESAGYLAMNRSKRSLSLDYATPEGRQIILEMAREADIVMEQFRPGVMAKMGLGYEDFKKVNPKIIYVAITGYGQTGPYAHLAGHDLNYITLAGVLSGNAHEAPQTPLIQMADIAGGSYMAVMGCLAAVYARDRQGVGQYVDVSMMDGVMPLTLNARAVQWITGQNIARNEAFLSGGLVNYGIYQARDGRYLALGTLEAKFWARFCEAVDKPEWKSRLLAQNPEEMARYKQELSELFQTQDGRYWHDLGIAHDLLLNLVYEQDEVDQDPQIQARKMVAELEHPTAGKIKTIGVPLKFSSTQAAPQWAPPLLGEDSLALLEEAGVSQATIEELLQKGILKCSGTDKP